MTKQYSIDWRKLRYACRDAFGYVADRKGRFIALVVGGVLSVNGYNYITSPEVAQWAEQNRRAAEEQQQTLQDFAAKAQVKAPGQGEAPVGALRYLFDFNTKRVTISGDGGTQEVSFDSVYKGELAKQVKDSICKDEARRDRFGLHYCQP